MCETKLRRNRDKKKSLHNTNIARDPNTTSSMIIKLIIIDREMSDWHYRNNLNVFDGMDDSYVRMVKWWQVDRSWYDVILCSLLFGSSSNLYTLRWSSGYGYNWDPAREIYSIDDCSLLIVRGKRWKTTTTKMRNIYEKHDDCNETWNYYRNLIAFYVRFHFVIEYYCEMSS